MCIVELPHTPIQLIPKLLMISLPWIFNSTNYISENYRPPPRLCLFKILLFYKHFQEVPYGQLF